MLQPSSKNTRGDRAGNSRSCTEESTNNWTTANHAPRSLETQGTTKHTYSLSHFTFVPGRASLVCPLLTHLKPLKANRILPRRLANPYVHDALTLHAPRARLSPAPVYKALVQVLPHASVVVRRLAALRVVDGVVVALRRADCAAADVAARAAPGIQEQVVGYLRAAEARGAEEGVEVAWMEGAVFRWFRAVLVAGLFGLGRAHAERWLFSFGRYN